MQYTGRENDGTGLYYYRNRYFSPNLRRFISRDPLGEAAGENEYSYVKNNPINLTDPLGLQEGPVNYLRNPFPPENWVGNGIANSVNEAVSVIVDLDEVAKAAWDLGNWCLPLSERLWAAAKLASNLPLPFAKFAKVGAGALNRIPWGRLSKAASKGCFVKGTPIHTKNGLVPIEEIKAGDEVLSFNEQTKQKEYKPVVETYIRQTEAIVRLNIEGEAKPLETTPEHPFYVKTRKARDALSANDDEPEWLEAGNLQVGDEVLSAGGAWQQVISITRETKGEQVYNFAVEDNHNYFVGVEGVLVHNKCFDDLVKAAQDNYPKKAGKIENHHIDPKYTGGAADGPTVPLDAAYHQQITNLFRELWKYGQGPISDPAMKRKIMDEVYRQFPLPPGYSY